MNNIFTKTIEIKFSLLTLFILLINVEINAQCSSNIVAVRDTIACGESVTLQTINLGGGQDDDFNGNTLSGLWSAVSANYTIGGPCGSNPNGGQHLWFGNGANLPRYARTIQLDASCGGTISFSLNFEKMVSRLFLSHSPAKVSLAFNWIVLNISFSFFRLQLIHSLSYHISSFQLTVISLFCLLVSLRITFSSLNLES